MNFDNVDRLELKPKLGQRLMIMLRQCSDARLKERLTDIIAQSQDCQHEHDQIGENLKSIEQSIETRLNELLTIKK
jgi:hypothetical protein